jgi:hypothetical protein
MARNYPPFLVNYSKDMKDQFVRNMAIRCRFHGLLPLVPVIARGFGG